MLVLLVLCIPAFADTPPGPILDGFPVASRDDAPTDARIPLDANFEPVSTVIAGPGAPFALEAEVLYGQHWSPSLAELLPPVGGWVPGEVYTVSVAEGYGYGSTPTGTHELTFTAGAAPAAAPTVPEIVSVEVGDWSPEPLTYDRGCCEFTRAITLHVRDDAVDPWGRVELWGDFPDRASDVLLTAEIGPGEHTFGFGQWEETGQLYPTCLEVVGVAPDGERGAGTEVCFELDEPPPSEDATTTAGTEDPTTTGTACGFRAAPTGGIALGLILLATRRRRSLPA